MKVTSNNLYYESSEADIFIIHEWQVLNNKFFSHWKNGVIFPITNIDKAPDYINILTQSELQKIDIEKSIVLHPSRKAIFIRQTKTNIPKIHYQTFRLY